ncbi:MAG: T9SS type A sorting domain-containing protein [Saprospiraceae bacterium]|nr:T9SS type A sorting domain-containing protein [Saprospiraceae bacterium]
MTDMYAIHPAAAIDPKIGPLANNGGSTFTHALLSLSPAFKAADPGSTLTEDQRGTTRPQFGIRDIGAFESTVSLIPDYTITTTGNNIVITDNSGNGDVLDVSESGSNIRFVVTPNTRTYSIDGGSATAFTTPADVALVGATSITINAAGGNDIIDIGAFTANLPSLTINGGTGDDVVNFNGDINFASDANLDVDLQNDDATPGVDQVTVAANANLILSGSGTATIKVSRNVTINSGGSIETENGNLTVEANQQGTPTAGNFVGVNLDGSSLQVNGSGLLSVKGQGGNSGTNQHGIQVVSAGKIQGGSGMVAVEGIGGASGGSNNHGVNIVGINSRITSSGGSVEVKGTGGGSGSSVFNYGVSIDFGGEITAGGSGMVTVEGIGGASGANHNYGVYVLNADSRISSSGGSVEVKGMGGNNGALGSNFGVVVNLGGEITGGSSGSVTVEGTGGASGGANYGVYVLNANSRITSSGGSVEVKGMGGGSGSSSNNFGVVIQTSGEITAGGSGTVTVEGLGGSPTGSSNYGININGTNSRISSSGGSVEVKGTGGGSGSSINNYGVYVQAGGAISADGSGTVTVEGLGGSPTGSSNYGININGTNSRISSSGGSVEVKGTGGGSSGSAANYGVYIISGGEISAGGSGTVTVEGIGGASSGNNNFGVYVLNANSRITSSGGSVEVKGTGNTGTNPVEALRLQTSGAITSGSNADITILANGVNIISSGFVNSGTGTTTIRPRTAGTLINLGGADVFSGSPLTLGLTDTELDLVTASTLIIGDVNSGNLTVSAAISRPAATHVQLRSGGDVVFNQNLNTGGGTLLLDPGTSPAAVKPTFNGTDATAGTVSFASDLAIVINGTSPGDGTSSTYSRLTVVGMVNLDGVDLVFSGAYTPTDGDVFLIVDNDDTDPIIGTFNGLAEGATINNFLGSGLDATISYIGGTGNDVVLTVVAACPSLTTAPGEVQIANSTCTTGCAVSGGSIIPPTTGCPTGSSIQYSTDGGQSWSTTLPIYNVTGPAQTIQTRCVCDEDANTVSPASTGVTTVPGTCVTPNAPTGTLAITNSTCTDCTVGGGSIAIGTVSGTGGTIEYSTDGGTTWSSTLPSYNQTGPAQTIIASVLGADGCRSGSMQVGQTIPGQCISPTAVISNNNGLDLDCDNPQTTLSVTAAVSYNWARNDSPYSTDQNISVTQEGTYAVTITAANGCTASSSVMVNFSPDNMPPSINCPPTQTLVLGVNCTALLPNYTSLATTGDNCGVQSVTQSPTAGTLVSGAGNMVVRLYATDINNNIDSCSFTVIKVDNTPPTIQCFNQTVTFNGENTIPLNAGSLVDTTDNCGVATIVLSPTGISCEQVGQTVPVTVTVTDINGNPSTCTSNITIGGLPCGWSQNPNGVNCADGNSIAYNPVNGVWTATSTNCFYGPGFTSDATAFAQRTLCGDGSITAQVTDISGTALGWAGVVMRESNAAGAKKAQLMTNLSTLSRREFRTTTNGAANPQQFPSQSRYWLRIVRAGSQFSMYVSPNGLAWYFVGAQNIPMNACIQVGLVTTNYQQTSTVTATFANVGFTGSNVPPLVGVDGAVSHELQAAGFEAYPNPTSGELNVDLAQYLGRAVRVEVYSLTGQLLHFVEIEEVQTVIEQLDLSAFQNGMYLVKVKTDGLPDAVKRIVLSRE